MTPYNLATAASRGHAVEQNSRDGVIVRNGSGDLVAAECQRCRTVLPVSAFPRRSRPRPSRVCGSCDPSL